MKRKSLFALAVFMMLTLSSCGCKHESAALQDDADATCTEDGYTGDIYCPECEQIITVGEVIPAFGHTEDLRNAEEATCSKEGYTGDIYCVTCGEQLEKGYSIETLPHSKERINVVEATCTNPGNTGDVICTVCGTTIENGEWINQLPHEWETANPIPPTCIKEGYEGDLTCKNCGKEQQGGSVPVTDHSFTDGVCTICGWLTPGLYIDNELILTWDELKEYGYVTVNNGQLKATQGNFQNGKLIIGEDVTYIDGNYSEGFREANVTEIWIPRTVTKLGNYLIYRNNTITDIVMYCQVNELTESSFYGCRTLKNIILSDSIKYINKSAFADCSSLINIQWPTSLEYIGRDAFQGSGLKKVVLPEGVKEIGNDAFSNSAITAIELPSTLENMGGGVFGYCENLVSIDMSACEKLTYLKELMFIDCVKLTNVMLPPNLKTMDGRMFMRCESLHSIELPEGLTSINTNPYYATFLDSSITEIVIPKSLITIDDLGGCPITSIKYLGSEAQWKMTTGYGNFSNATVEYNYSGS